ncbi:hypothetical protein BHE74_00056069, partial [Ensete ventricosum]
GPSQGDGGGGGGGALGGGVCILLPRTYHGLFNCVGGNNEGSAATQGEGGGDVLFPMAVPEDHGDYSAADSSFAAASLKHKAMACA